MFIYIPYQFSSEYYRQQVKLWIDIFGILILTILQAWYLYEFTKSLSETMEEKLNCKHPGQPDPKSIKDFSEKINKIYIPFGY